LLLATELLSFHQNSSDLPHEGSRYEIFKVHLARFCDTIPEWDNYEWKKLIQAYNECTPDEIGKAVHKAAISAFDRGTPRQISLEDLLEQRKLFQPANIANPEQIAAIRRNSKGEAKATSEDNSIFRVERIEEFELLLGKKHV
jgi:SpoVK/Ycf46/Vps4 family AAA+-type ATPase